MKRLSKLQATSTSGEASTLNVPPPQSKPAPAQIKPSPTPKRSADPPTQLQAPSKKQATTKLDLASWHHSTVALIFNVTLDVWFLRLSNSQILADIFLERRSCKKRL